MSLASGGSEKKQQENVNQNIQDLELTPTPRRRQSSISINSSNSVKLTFPINTATYDSGNYSSSCSNVSDSGTEGKIELPTTSTPLKEREQVSNFTLQDVSKLLSELERLHKSEQWYKQELRQQKDTRLDVLERLYVQERKYMQENQRLQRECVRLYTKCSEMERELAEQNDKSLEKLCFESGVGSIDSDDRESSFEIKQQHALIKDQQELISVLRKQKRALLEDLERLGVEKDERVGELQRTLSRMELEHKTVKTECKKLKAKRRELEQTLEEKTNNWEMDTGERIQLEITITELREQLIAKEKLLASKEHEFLELQCQFRAQLDNTTNMDEVHLLSLSHQREVNATTAEITGLKASLLALQEEIVVQNERASMIEDKERLIENLRSKLEERLFELENLQGIDIAKTQQISELELNVERLQKEREWSQQQLQETKITLKSVEQRLVALNTQYASMCALCERTKLSLELQNIEQGKRKFETDTNLREIEQLRERLKEYLARTAEMSSKINSLEIDLQESRSKKSEMLINFKDVSRKLEEEMDRSKIVYEEKMSRDIELQNCRDEADLRWQFWQTELEEHARKNKTEITELKQKLKARDETIERLKDEKNRLEIDSNDEENYRKYSKYMSEEHFKTQMSVQKLKTELQDQQHFITDLTTENQRLKLYIEERDALSAFTETHTTEISVDAELAKLTEQNRPLFNSLNEQREILIEKENLLARFKAIIAADTEMQKQLIEKKLICQPDKKINLLATTNKNLKQSVSIMESLIKQNQMLYQKFQKTDRYKLEGELRSLNYELSETYQRCQIMERELQRDFNINNQGHDDLPDPPTRMTNSELRVRHDLVSAKIEKVERLNKELKRELSEARVANEELHEKMKKINENAHEDNKTDPAKIQKQIEANIKAIEPSSNREESSAALGTAPKPQVSGTFVLKESDERELLSLRVKVRVLEEQLQASNIVDEKKREARIDLINKLLAQQNDKVQQLQAAQAEWEELLKTLNDTQRLEEQTRGELKAKSTELEELNVLFEEQNKELQELHENSFLEREKLAEESTKLRETFQQQKKVLQEQLKVISKENAEQKRLIEEYKLENLRNAHNLSDFSNDNASEMAAQNRELRIVQTKQEMMLQERENEAKERKELVKELSELRQSKRAAMLMPEPISFCETASTHSEAESIERDASGSYVSSCNDNDERLRILTKILESEYKRKMQHYELHIRALVGNVKSLKKDLKAAEAKTSKFRGEKTCKVEELQELQVAKSTIKLLEQTLKDERDRFAATDAGKKAQTEAVGTHEVSNLIDDYKKLIQQSAMTTQRPNTRAVLDLIQRSNQCAPNLQQLESNIFDLSTDLKAFLAAYSQNVGGSTLTRDALKAQPSLLDELRVASENI